MSSYPVCAWRVSRWQGQLVKRLSVRTSDYGAMCRWLERSRGARRPHGHTLWIEEESRPATALQTPRARRL